jgi:hypothetical protein
MLVTAVRPVRTEFCSIQWDHSAKCVRILNGQDRKFAFINVRFSVLRFVSTPLKVELTGYNSIHG